MSRHLTSLIEALTDAELVAKLEGFAHSDDEEMTRALIAEAKRRGL